MIFQSFQLEKIYFPHNRLSGRAERLPRRLKNDLRVSQKESDLEFLWWSFEWFEIPHFSWPQRELAVNLLRCEV